MYDSGIACWIRLPGRSFTSGLRILTILAECCFCFSGTVSFPVRDLGLVPG